MSEIEIGSVSTTKQKPPEAPSGGLMREASRARRISVLCRFDYY